MEGRKLMLRFVSGAALGGWLFVRVMVCVVGAPSPLGGQFCPVHISNCGEKTSEGGDRVIGCWQAVVLFSPRQRNPNSPRELPTGGLQAFVSTWYPCPVECST